MKVRVLALATLLVVASTACGTSGSSGATTAKIWRIGFTATSFGPIGPMDYTGYPGYYSLGALYPTLVGLDSSGQIVGDLATGWTPSGDRMSWTFKLRTAGWSDGKPITSRDVAFSVATALAHAHDKLGGSWTSRLDNVAGARAIDDQTVAVDLKKPDFLMPAAMINFWIIPQHIWSVGGATVESLDQLGNSMGPMVSGGPYSLVQRDATSALFTANPHWMHGKVATAGFGIRIYANDDALILALKSNEIDVAPAFAGPLDPRSLPGSIKRLDTQNLQIVSLMVNMADAAHPELALADVRRAFSLAVDRSQLARVAFSGSAVAATSDVVSNVKPWHNDALKADPYALAQANSMLDGLGFQRGADGIRVANGHRMSYEVLEQSGGVNAQARTLILQGLKAVGVETAERSLGDYPGFTAELRPHKWQLSLITLSTGDGLFSIGLFASTGPSSQPNYAQGAYDSGYRSAQYDSLDASLQDPSTTPAEAKKLMDQMQAVIATDRPWIFLVEPKLTALERTTVSGVLPGIYGAPNLRDRQSWAGIRVSG
jgi:peptide/nickel transport system substrate-binding protein